MLITLVVLLGATAIAVTLTRRLRLGSILGYLLAGVAIGPWGFGLITDIGQIRSVSELGIIMLLFLIGLELRPHRLFVMRKALLGLGPAQLIPIAVLIALIAKGAGLGWPDVGVLGAGLALSSTAIALPMLQEKNLLPTAAGRDAFAVLLFQDIAFVPLVALVPLLSSGHLTLHVPWIEVLRALAAVAAILIVGGFVLRPVFQAVGGTKTLELFSATALLVVLGAALIAQSAGLSASLGAFIAGVLLSDSEYRHELRADIEPFQGLLLGFFFVSVGMSADIGLAASHPVAVALAAIGLIVVKTGPAFALGFAKRDTIPGAIRFALALAPGSELAFVFFAAAEEFGALSQSVGAFATLAIGLSMAATPVIFALSENLLIPRLERRRPPRAESFPEATTPVLICGFGRMGQIVGRVLNMQRVQFTALDKSPAQISVVRRFGGKVYFGDPARLEVLRAAGAQDAKLLVVTPDEEAAVLAIVDLAQRHFPHLTILARARNRRSLHRLMDRGLPQIVRETYFSSLKLAEWALEDLGVKTEEARRAIALFTDYDERLLEETHPIYTDEKQLIQTTQQAAEELAGLLDADRQRHREGDVPT